jgi:hypothetical protein
VKRGSFRATAFFFIWLDIMRMRCIAHSSVASAVAVLLVSSTAQAQARGWAFDFKMTDTMVASGETATGVTTGHAVVSKGRVRIDMKRTGRAASMPRMGPGDEASMIVEQDGKLITYLLPKEKRYMQINPAEMMKQMQTMMQGMGAAMKFDVSGPEPKLENLGQGPVILGHETVHYRVTTGMRVTMSAMGERETMEMSTTTDQYFARRLGEVMDPFSGMTTMRETSSMFGVGNKAYIDKMWAVQAKLPKAPELRAEQRTTMSRAGLVSNIRTVREVTKIQRVKAPADLFVIPRGYTKMDMGPIAPAGK